MEQFLTIDAIVLKHHKVKENDVILNVFSREHGKMPVIAKGLQKGTSKLAGILQLFMRVQMNLVKGKQMYVVTGATLSDAYSDMRKDYLRTMCALYVADLLDHVLEEGAPEEAIFEFSNRVFLMADHLAPAVLCFYFEWRLLDLLGYAFPIEVCSCCGIAFGSGAMISELTAQGDFLCASCRSGQHVASARLHAEDRAVLRVFRSDKPALLAAITLTDAQIRRLTQFIWMRYHELLPYPLKSRKIVMQMLHVGIDKGF